MADPSLVEDWLDRWEDFQRVGQAIPLDQFIEQHCQGAPPEAVQRLRDRVSKLRSMNVRLKAAGLDDSSDDAARDMGEHAASHVALQLGDEPVLGYLLEAKLGEGGFGEVWRAAGPGGFPVALKFIRLERGGDARELRALESLKEVRHPHLLAVFGAWRREDCIIVAMELADRTLRDRLKEAEAQGGAGIPRDELLRYMAEAAEALDHLHRPFRLAEGREAKGIQHLDVKPHNLLLTGDSVKVADFGLAQCLEHSVTTHRGGLTIAYAAPEVFDGKATTQSDQYSLAVTYCELRAGRLPFRGSRMQLVKAHTQEEPDLSMLPDEERPVVRRALAKAPAERWPSCGAFVEALRQTRPEPVPVPGQTVQASDAPSTTTPEAPEQARRPTVRDLPKPTTSGQQSSSRGRALPVGVSVGVLVLLAAGALALWLKNGNRPGEPPGGDPASQEPSAQRSEAPAAVTLAVLDFENHSKDPALDGFRPGLRDMLTTDLARVSQVKVVERSRLAAVLEEHQLAGGKFIDPRTAARLGKGLGSVR